MKLSIGTSLGAFLVLSAGVSQAANVIDFEDWNIDPGYLVSRGFHFSGDVSVSVDPPSGNPTNALHSLNGTFKFSSLDENLFAIRSLDLHEGVGSTGTVAIQLVGSIPFPPGGQVIRTFNLDGNPATYETFHPSGFEGMIAVHFYGLNAQGERSAGGFSVDSIVVPEPGALGLMLFGFTGIRRRRPAGRGDVPTCGREHMSAELGPRCVAGDHRWAIG